MNETGSLRKLLSQAEGYDYYAAEHCISRIGDGLLRDWHELSLDEFGARLRHLWQEISAADRSPRDAEEAASRQLGKLEGLLSVYEELFREEAQRQRYVKEAAEHSEKAREILACLEAAGGTGMRHKALAEAIHTTPSSLSNIMTRVLRSGAVTASRVGKYTFYYLTPTGQRFLRRDGDPKTIAPRQAYRLPVPQSISVGEKFRIHSSNGAISGPMELKAVLHDGRLSHVRVEDLPEGDGADTQAALARRGLDYVPYNSQLRQEA